MPPKTRSKGKLRTESMDAPEKSHEARSSTALRFDDSPTVAQTDTRHAGSADDSANLAFDNYLEEHNIDDYVISDDEENNVRDDDDDDSKDEGEESGGEDDGQVDDGKVNDDDEIDAGDPDGKNPEGQAVEAVSGKNTNIDLASSPRSDIKVIFQHMIEKVLKEDDEDFEPFRKMIEAFKSQKRTLRLATMFSGTESPLLALDMINEALEAQPEVKFKPIHYSHEFSAEIEPFKQAYIEANFKPRYLFRNALEVANGVAATVLGDWEIVPAGIDLLIAGSSCKTISHLNNQMDSDLSKGTLSGDTFQALVNYCNKEVGCKEEIELPNGTKKANGREQPLMVILENVYNSRAWDIIQGKFQDIGYAVKVVTCDTRLYYLPQTRRRRYMLGLLETHFENHEAILNRWEDVMTALKQPASSPMTDFLLSAHDSRTMSVNSEVSMSKGTSAWESNRGRHEIERRKKKLGHLSPMATSKPEYVTSTLQARPFREKDLLSIKLLDNARQDIDIRYKS